jgi:hypothetical protein
MLLLQLKHLLLLPGELVFCSVWIAPVLNSVATARTGKLWATGVDASSVYVL